MNRCPFIPIKTKKICIICEGNEEYLYLERLKQLNVWSHSISITLKNAKSITNISAQYQNVYNMDNFDLVLILCDTEMTPYEDYLNLKTKIANLYGSKQSAESVIFFANPCTMQILLLHFDFVKLSSNNKNSNSKQIEELTGVKKYQANEHQIKSIINKITSENYIKLKENLSKLNISDKEIHSTNFLKLLHYLEQNETIWINKLKKKLNKNR